MKRSRACKTASQVGGSRSEKEMKEVRVSIELSKDIPSNSNSQQGRSNSLTSIILYFSFDTCFVILAKKKKKNDVKVEKVHLGDSNNEVNSSVAEVPWMNFRPL